MAGKAQKLSLDHLSFIDNYCTNNLITQITIADVKKELKHNFENLQNVSNETLRREMKWRLKLSYKSVKLANRKLDDRSNKIMMLRAALLIQRLLWNDIECIFIDEFSVNSKTYKAHS